MVKSRISLWVGGLALLVSCGDPADDGDSGIFGESGSPPGSGSATMQPADGTVDGTADGPGTMDGGSTVGPTATTTSPADSTGPGFIFDVGGGDTEDVNPGDCCGPSEWSYIWIANSSQSTVSKINTRTMVEEGRFLTRDTPGNPSRTSVSVDGRAVAVANRNGGVIKIWARAADCTGGNTSTGAADVLPWGTDDCVAWFTPFPQASSQRPVAWTTGELNPATCDWEDQKVWTAEGRGGTGAFCDDDRVYVHRLDGETGAVEDTVEVLLPCTTFGVYGGVVDANNDLWLTRLFEGSPGAVRVDYETLTYETIGPFYGYGITVDHNGRIWGGTGVPGRWDPVTSTWDTIVGSIPNAGVGLAEDHVGRMWVGINGGIQAVDVETLDLLDTVMFAGEMIQSKGISVDVDGFIWAVPDSQTRAYKVDPDVLTYEQFNGLQGAYTYSDMTGGAINSVACNPPAG